MNESLVKYLAGLLDADGSLSFAFKRDLTREDRHFVRLCLSLASSDAVDKHGFVASLPETTSFGGFYRMGANQQFTAWRVTNRPDLEMLLPRLVKHMVIKGKHWDWLLKEWRNYRRISVSDAERAALTASCKQSRIDRVGPLKPKNHPTWAWLAGYLDGDGWYRQRYCEKNNYWSMSVGAVAHVNDAAIVFPFLQKAFHGNIAERDNKQEWVRNLGARDRSFALRFLPQIARHARLKRHKIDQMIHHHRQRLSASTPAGDATV